MRAWSLLGRREKPMDQDPQPESFFESQILCLIFVHPIQPRAWALIPAMREGKNP